MSNSLRAFNNEEFGTIRTVMIDGEPWFVGVENRRKRILQNGGTRAEADKVTKLSVIANDAALRNAFDLALKNMCVASYARHGDEVGV